MSYIKRLSHKLLEIANFFYKKRIVIFFEKKLPDPTFSFIAKKDVTVRLLTDSDISTVEKKFETLKLVGIKERFQAGHVCFVAELDGEIVHTQWFSFGDMFLDAFSRRISLDPESAYAYDGFTLPDYRGLGMMGKTFSDALQYLYAKRGITHFYVATSHTNLVMQKLARRHGLREIGTVTYIRILTLGIIRLHSVNKEDKENLKKIFAL
jgi:GNAT superfamily N-acetyltransferase